MYKSWSEFEERYQMLREAILRKAPEYPITLAQLKSSLADLDSDEHSVRALIDLVEWQHGIADPVTRAEQGAILSALQEVLSMRYAQSEELRQQQDGPAGHPAPPDPDHLSVFDLAQRISEQYHVELQRFQIMPVTESQEQALVRALLHVFEEEQQSGRLLLIATDDPR